MFECVVNISEGADLDLIDAVGAPAGDLLLDTHADPFHNRAVLTLAGPAPALFEAVCGVAREAVARMDFRSHAGAHPRIGVLDVVPFVDLSVTDVGEEAVRLRDRFAAWAATELALPCFLYGPGVDRTLPELRRRAWVDLAPDVAPAGGQAGAGGEADREAGRQAGGEAEAEPGRRAPAPQVAGPHPTAGACAVGARGVLVAFNLWLGAEVAVARQVAAAIRRPGLRALGLQVGARVQVSCNLTDPLNLGPADVFDLVASLAPVQGAELVGLVPAAVLAGVVRWRWTSLDLSPDRTIESRLAGGLGG